MLTDSALAPSLTAVHLAIAMLRRHRTPGVGVFHPYVALSFAFAASPWLWHSMTGMALTLAAHILWFFACEALAPSPALPAAATSPAGASPLPAAATARLPDSPSSGRPRGFERVPVLAVLEEADAIRTFRLARPAGFDFLAGQFVAVRVHIEGKPHVRCYSISSAPEAVGYLEISVRRQGLVSRTLHATLRTGSQLAINRPAGQFVYPAHDDRPLALLAGGIGITPLLSMLRHAVTSDPTRPVTLIYSARREQDVAFVNELRVIAERHPQVRIALTLTQATGATRWGLGRVDAAMIAQHVGDPANTIFCLCGPGSMLSGLREVLQRMGVPDSQIRFEQFDTAVAASLLNVVSPVEPAAAGPASVPGTRPDASHHNVTFSVSGRTAVVSAAHTLLDAAEAQGVPIHSSCRAGVCQSCRTRVVQGEVDCRSDVLDPDDRSAGFVLPCVSWANTDCVLEA
jgi:ferredoxin-NADP reductase